MGLSWKKMKMNRTKIMACCETQVVCFVLFQTIFENVFLALLMKYRSRTSWLYSFNVVLQWEKKKEFLAFLPIIIHRLSYPFAITVYATFISWQPSLLSFSCNYSNAKLVHHNTPSCLLNPSVDRNIKKFFGWKRIRSL